MRSTLAACIVAAGFSASAGAASAASTTPTIRPGDKLSVVVYNHPELSGDMLVGSDGSLTVPLIGAVPAAGRSTGELRSEIVSGLAQYVRKPAAEVRLVGEGSSVFVVGGTSGPLAFHPGETLGGAMDDFKAGPAADLKRVALTRNGKSIGPFDIEAMRAKGDAGIPLLPGDTIRVPAKAIAVNVGGQVKTPGTVYLNEGDSVAQALAAAGGPAENGNDAAVVLNRNGQRTTYSSGSVALAEPAKNGDSINVPYAIRVEVIGQVGHAGEIALKQDASLLSALYLAGGPGTYADLKKVTLLHHRAGTPVIINVTAMTHGRVGQVDNDPMNPLLNDGDVVFVPEGKKIDWRGFFRDLLIAKSLTHK